MNGPSYTRRIREGEDGGDFEITRAAALSLISRWYHNPQDILDQLDEGKIDFIAGPASTIIRNFRP